MGKAYANRRKKTERPESDFYQTPRPLTWELLKLNLFDYNKTVLEPAAGAGAIKNILKDNFGNVSWGDIQDGNNFLEETLKKEHDYIITNPPFSLFDDFVMQAKQIAKEKIAFIGKTNFFGAKNRYYNGVWENLKYVYIFNQQVDYRFFREDNRLVCGNLVTGWFIWDLSWKGNWWNTSIIDIGKYVRKKNEC